MDFLIRFEVYLAKEEARECTGLLQAMAAQPALRDLC
jgi:hypothetical protein